MRMAALIGLLVILIFPVLAAAQSDEDPFGGRGSVERNPFDEPPHIPETPATDDLRRLMAHIEELKARLAQSELEARSQSVLNEHLRKATIEIRAHSELVRSAHLDLLERMLAADEASLQLLALSNLQQWFNRSRDEIGQDQFMEHGLVPHLQRLLESDSSAVHKAAVQTLVAVDPLAAAGLGFQSGREPWLSEHRTGEQRILNREARMDYYETRLADVLEEIEAEYQISVMTAKGVDTERLVTFRQDKTLLRKALGRMLEDLDLVFRLTDTELHILPAGHEDAGFPLTYNVRGLMTDRLAIDEIADVTKQAVIQDRGEEETGFVIRVIDEQRILISGSESQHTRAASTFSSVVRWQPGRDD